MPPKKTKKTTPESSGSKTKKRTTRKKLVIQNVLEKVILSRSPVKVDVNTPNPLTEAILGSEKPVENPVEVEEKKRRAPNLMRWNEKTGKYEKLKKTARFKILGCDYNYEPTEEDAPRVQELNRLKIDDLKKILEDLREGSTEGGLTAGARRHNEFVNLIICIENAKRRDKLQRLTQLPEPEVIQPPAPEPPQISATVEPTQISATVEPTEISAEEGATETPAPEPPQISAEEEATETPAPEPPQMSAEEGATETPAPEPEEPYTQEPPTPKSRESISTEDKTDENQDIPETGSLQYNLFLKEQEKKEFEDSKKNPDANTFLYPSINDPNFNVKIANRKEFNDTQYDGTIYDVKKQSDILCNSDFELLPHQLFVKNFLSFQTPYNALLLYHGLGSGKTSSAIGVAEEMRTYMRQVGFHQKIMVVASPNVQKNFELQLFDERKLRLEDGIWRINTPMGNDLLNEINPTQLKGLPKDKVITQIKRLINQYYTFMGYRELSNFIHKKITIEDETKYSRSQIEKIKSQKIKALFNNRLVIIDEVHNIRISDDNRERKKTAALLMEVVKHAENMRLLLLSATPMFNSYTEIIWLVNLMNALDKRSLIKENEVFDKEGNFLPERTLPNGIRLEGGKELLQRKLTGYISYVRGENPFTFPYRVYPTLFSPENTFVNKDITYPTMQMNRKPIETSLKHVPVYLTKMGEYQQRGYDYIMNNMRTKAFKTTNLYGEERVMPSFENMESFGYIHLQQPLESLNIVYPSVELDNALSSMITEEATPESAEEASPESAEEASPESAEEASPESTEEASPESAEEASPESTEEASPESAEEASPESAEEASPESAEEASPESAEEASPESAEEASPESSTSAPEYDTEAAETIIKNMVGKTGLSNIVTYKSQNSPYPIRYDFEYKPSILQKYGSIFKQENIHKYSCKIHKICESIRKSKGIVLVYSEYIDGGIVPIALALEEMGFARYGSAKYTKSLFKKPPAKPIDSLTMMEYGDNKESKQAKYVMITGDKSFSPNNLEDIKYVTNPENKNGENVKVILISKAGAEGLDFKNIRQVHILEPWYNMNRMEQIIGRGVRNLSHCQLPFEQRNVEIYLHCSLPQNDEETADLYIYRFAEKKALQIGKVTRLLKETATDCILNIGQTNFTPEKMAELVENQQIQIQLSSTDEPTPFKIGDKPFTEICDYMDNCSFKCSPEPQADAEIIYDTYNSDFVKINYSMIVKRIRQIFKEQPVIHKTQLVNSINVLKKFPIEHIDYVLSNFVENKHEPIYDKYGRAGYLVNREQYYAFQPIEITDEEASYYERAAPIEYKHESLNMDVPEKQQQDIKNTILPKNESTSTEYQMVIENVKINLYNAVNKGKLETKEKDWFKHMGNVINVIQENHNIPLQTIIKYVIWHNLDILPANVKLTLIKHLYGEEQNSPKNEFETHIQKYFDDKIMTNGSSKAIVLSNATQTNFLLYIQSSVDKTEWNEAQDTDYTDFKEQLRNQYIVLPQRLNETVGFMHPFETDNIVFKTKLLGEGGNNKGVTCWKVGKSKSIHKLNSILGKTMYDTSNTKYILADGVCIIMEIIMRYMTENNESTNGKVFFMDLEKTLVNRLINL